MKGTGYDNLPPGMLDALDTLEARLNRELPANWRHSYDYADDAMGAVHEAWYDAELEPQGGPETAAINLLESHLLGDDEPRELDFHNERENWGRVVASYTEFDAEEM